MIKRICLLTMLCLLALAVLGCSEDITQTQPSGETTQTTENQQTTETEDTSNSSEPDAPTEPDATTEPTDAPEPDVTTEPTDATQPDIPTDPASPIDPEGGEVTLAAYYDNDTLEMSVAFLPEGVVYLLDSTGYWEGTYFLQGNVVTLTFAYSTQQGGVDAAGNLRLEGRDGSFTPANINAWGPKLDEILGGEDIQEGQELTGSWYNATEDSTIVFRGGGSVYQVLSVAFMEGTCQWDGQNYIFQFTLGGKTFGPYTGYLNDKGELVLSDKEGTFVRQD